MATIANIKPSFMVMSHEKQFKLIEAIQLSRLTPKIIVKARTAKPKKKQLTFKDLLSMVKDMNPVDRNKFMLDNGMI